uniref:ABC transporter ATP-binding protein n=1 Tax=Yoonia sp. TaxID=2212373 RepID=UPI004047ECB6|tara:strand:+ start:1416 stop:2084 length:669 start_codon:yes stop_codon:yes gene_type:complete
MITFQHVHKSFDAGGSRKIVANDINAVFPSGVCVALLGRNGAGKSTLMQMVGGTVKPDSGLITVQGSISWPVGFAGSFHRDLTGAQNTRFIARAYGIDTDSLLEFVKDFAELDNHFHMPVRSYSSGMRSRLAFGISIGIPFDTYLVDEVTSVGDAAFKLKSRLVFLERLKTSGAVVITHSMPQVRKMCDTGAVLENGNLYYYENLEEAIAHHHDNMGSDEDE